jgi:hypothetical protein
MPAGRNEKTSYFVHNNTKGDENELALLKIVSWLFSALFS